MGQAPAGVDAPPEPPSIIPGSSDEPVESGVPFPSMKKLFAAPAAVVMVAAMTACGSDDDSKPKIPTLEGSDATLIAQVDCGDDGVANVNVIYGQVNEDRLIGRNAITQSVGGGSATFDERYGIGEGDHNLLFTITTSPTKGTCTTTLTDDDTGDVLAEKTTAGTAKLRAKFAG